MSTAIALRKSRPALRLADTKTLSHDEWLQVRKRGIGSSDAAAAIGLNPYQSPLELWMVKTGREHLLVQKDIDAENSPLYWGKLLEPLVAAHYSRVTGKKVRRINAVLQHPDEDKHWMLANLDYSVAANDEVQILECKTAGEFGARLWRDGVPEYVQCQVQHQLAVTGKAAADVAVLLCGHEVKVFRVLRDDAVIERVIELERQFWHYVESDTPPPADGSESSGKALRGLYPMDRGTVIDCSEDPELSGVFARLVKVRDELDAVTRQEGQLKQRIQERMGDASRAVFGTGSVSWKASKSGSRRFLVNP